MKLYIKVIFAAFSIICLSQSCFAECPSADLTGDCRINFNDFAVLADSWLTVYDFNDLASITDNWLIDGSNSNLFFEGFETGDFHKYPWTSYGNDAWTIVSAPVFQGIYAAKSGTIFENQTSVLELSFETDFNGICFYGKISSEENYDFMQFYIDGILQEEWSGSLDWTQYTFSISPGLHTFKWSYSKDDSGDENQDCCLIDNIKLGNLITAPGVCGMSYEDANAMIINAGIVSNVSKMVFSNTTNQGCVISQNPSADEYIMLGETMNLIISAGAAPCLVSDITWVDIDESGFSGEGYAGQMSKYETTNAQFCEFLNTALASGDITVSNNYVYGTNGSNVGEDFIDEIYYQLDGTGFNFNGATNGGAARIHYNGSSFSVDAGFDNHPVTFVSWYGAMAFCNYYDFKLPLEWQWKAVADYNRTYTYGCGTYINNSIANYLDSDHPHGTTVVGAFGEFGYGMCDMAGNVFEWAADHNSTSNLSAYCGGSWNLNSLYCRISYSSYYSLSGQPNIGFRVCR